MARYSQDEESRNSGRKRGSGADIAAKSQSSQVLQAGLLVSLCLIIFWAPIPLGSNRPYFLAILSLLTGICVLVWVATLLSGTMRVSHYLSSLWPAGVALVLALAVAVIQIVDLRAIDSYLGTDMTKVMGHPIWELAGESLGQNLPSYVTVNPALALSAIQKVLLYAAIFLLAFVLARQASRARILLTVVAMSGAVCVFAGFTQIALGVSFGEVLVGEPGRESLGRFSSTFVNPNHLATFAGVALIAALGLTHEALSKGMILNRGRSIAIRTIANTVFGPALPGIASTILLVGAIGFSSSRGGTLAIVAGCAVWALIVFLAGRSRSGGGASPHSAILLGTLLLAGALFTSSHLFARLDSSALQDSSRAEIASRTLDAVAASPWLGNGFGAFISYYPLYVSEARHGTVNAAHNDYLEALSDLGVIGGTALILAPAYLAFLAARGAFRRRKGRVFGAVAVGAATLCAVHAYFDFSLQIPAVGVLLFATLGVGVAQAWRGEDEDGGDPRMAA